MSVFVAWFEEESQILGATREARAQGLAIDDVYTPYPVHGMDDAMGLPRSRLTWVCFAMALLGLSCALVVQWWTSAVSWPLNIGGKPFNSLPAFVPVTFELTVLFAGLGTVAALFLRTRLRPRLGLPATSLERVTDDRFALALRVKDVGFDWPEAQTLCRRWQAVEMRLVEAGS